MASRCLAPQLVPFETSSERNVEQCSPSPSATAPTDHATHRKSQPAPPSSFGDRRRFSSSGEFRSKHALLPGGSVANKKIERRQAASRPVALTLRHVRSATPLVIALQTLPPFSLLPVPLISFRTPWINGIRKAHQSNPRRGQTGTWRRVDPDGSVVVSSEVLDTS